MTVGAAAVLVVLSACATAGPSEAGALNDDARLGVVELYVGDLETQRAFYEEVLELETRSESDSVVELGTETETLVALIPRDAPRAAANQAGLYHTALLYPDQESLANVLVRIAQLAPQSFAGASDHGVSEAFYFNDPEGNGVELYVDKPEDEWVWLSGRVEMSSEALDPNAFLAEHASETEGSAPNVGHLHLRVGDTAEAVAFYVDVLGFDITREREGAVFMSVGGYHHHLAANVWESAGAGEREDSLGLASLSILVPAADDLEALIERLDRAGIAYSLEDETLQVADPWGNQVRISAEANQDA